MSDYIKREDAIREIKEWAVNLHNPTNVVLDDAICVLQDMLPADVVEVVRCKDCKYWRPDTRPEDSLEERTDGLWGWGNLCVKHLPNDELEAIEFGPEEFCNFGKRKDEKDD